MKHFTLFILLFTTIYGFTQYQIGHYSETFVDPDRNNRNIETEIYYPATAAGTNTPIASGQFPVVVFGHGFVMVWSAYENLWTEFVSRGYIMVFPRTEGSIVGTNHQEFGWDLQFLVTRIQDENLDNTSPLYGGVNPNTALMGHSMGGGAAFLAADSLSVNGNLNLKTLVGLAPAESTTNGVSSINSAKMIDVPSVILSGAQDGVTPPADHHIPMYDSLGSSCKTFISITGGAHCYFAESNFNCDFGESTSSSGISITRTEQHAVTFDFVNQWLDYTLKNQCSALGVFNDSLNNSARITFNQTCNILPLTANSAAQDANGTAADGSITVNANGGNAPYSYSLDGGTAQSSNQFTGLNSGNYVVTVTDNDGCSYQLNVTVGNTVGIEEVTNIFKCYPNPTKGNIILENAEAKNVETIIIRNIAGENIQSIRTSKSFKTIELDITTQPAGIYFIEAHSDNHFFVMKVVKQ